MYIEDDELMHYGIKYRSGRYPYGSGKDPYQSSGDFLSRVEELKSKGMSETQIAYDMGLSTTQFRVQASQAKHERRQIQYEKAKALQDKGYNPSEIARMMGFKSESSVRSLLNQETAARKNMAQSTAEVLRTKVDEKKMIDIGTGSERELGVSSAVMREASYILEREGYNVYNVGTKQINTVGQQTITPVLTTKDVSYKDVYDHIGEVQSITDYHSRDGGATFKKVEYPASISSDRVKIRYGEEGGIDKDGVIEIRRGVPDLDLGNSHYAQVRILVDGSHYLKGMAMYSDDMPDGADIVFNTNKKKGTPMCGPKDDTVLKGIKHDDPTNPFGASLRADGQSTYIGKDGKEHLSAINKLKSEGDWDSMSRNLSSQFLSKQPMQLIKQQLNLTYADRMAEYDEIKSMVLPTVKKKMLLDFADECESAAVNLKAAALPRQSVQVILPLTGISDKEIYAPNYKNGERVVLIRYPHGGTFEIPELVVNNKNKAGRSILGTDIHDAVGINAKVAERLSGADFDGDQVVVIPVNDRVHVKTTKPLDGLKGFDPKVEYARTGPDMKVLPKTRVGREMGVISNLITDMTLQGAPEEDLVKAVRHSMVVIDANKHELDYKKSERDNDIAVLKKRYQTHTELDGTVRESGAATLFSRRKQSVEVDERQGAPRIDPKTGEVSYKTSGRMYYDKKTGEMKKAMTKVSLMSTLDDANAISSGTPQEKEYARYVNRLKALANEARKEAMATPRLKQSPTAKEVYKDDVRQLRDDLDLALRNAPRERQAQRIANSIVKAQIQDNPSMDKKDIKKAGAIALANARATVGASGKMSRIKLTDRQWEAIQAGAVSDTMLEQILRYSDPDVVRQHALPKATTTLSKAKVNKINSMRNSGYTASEIAEAIGVSTSTVYEYVNG